MPNLKPLGQSKLAYSGIYGTNAFDKNASAQGENAIGSISTVGKWRQMEQTCSMVSLGSRSLLGILQGVKWDFRGHEETPEEIIDFLRMNFFERLSHPWQDITITLFKAVPYGFAPHEITTFADGGLTWLRDLSYRPPWTFDLYSVYKTPKNWMGATQRFYKDYTIESVDYGDPGQAGKGWLLWPTFGDNGGPFGEGFYRPLYAIYEEWVDAIKMRRIGVQKTIGVPMAFPRAGMKPAKTDIIESEEQLGMITTHEKGSVVVPNWVEKIEWHHPDAESLKTLGDVISDCETRIAIAFGAQYAVRGLQSPHGANAASQTDSEQLKNHRQYFIDWLCRQVQPIIDWLIIQNWGEQKYYPQLTGSAPETISPETLVNSIVAAANGSALIIDSSVRASVRSALQQEPEGDEVGDILAKKEEQVEAMKQQFDKANGDKEEEGEKEDSENIIDNPAPEKAVKNKEPEEEDETEEMTACKCGINHFEAGVKAPPKPGGQQRRTGPNGRDLSKIERLVRWNTIEMTLDNGANSLRQVLMDAREQLARDMIAWASNKGWENSAGLAKQLQKYAVKANFRKRIAKAIRGQLALIVDTAEDTVLTERENQGGNTSFAAGSELDDGFIDVFVEEATQEAINDTRAQMVKATLSMQAPSKEQILQMLKEASQELSATQASNTATIATTEVFARARAEKVQQLAAEGDVPKNVWYSAILDNNTCVNCEEADTLYGQLSGTPIAWNSPEMVELMPPNQRCLGGVRCRCQLIFEY